MAKLNGVDCVTSIHQEIAEGFKAAGIEYVARYLGDNWKSISKQEADVILDNGLKIVSIWETNPTNARYFTMNKGFADGHDAASFAQAIGQPEGSAIYFAVDYDMQPSDMKDILNYFLAVRRSIGNKYKVGVYGSYAVLEILHRSHAADFYWQTAAWSGGNIAEFIDILQYGFNKKIVGIPVDYNQVSTNAGSWGKGTQGSSPQPTPAPEAANIYHVQPGDTLSGIALHFGTSVDELVRKNNIRNPNLIYAGQVLAIPTSKGMSEYTIRPGDTLSQIAVNFGTTVDQLRALNRIANPDLILAGQKIRVK
ncbi:MAG: DUF1906 domain-containing protein [Bacillota bacterium]|nr:DUF1906 domain-containing protein [Bacillota bacterium]